MTSAAPPHFRPATSAAAPAITTPGDLSPRELRFTRVATWIAAVSGIAAVTIAALGGFLLVSA